MPNLKDQTIGDFGEQWTAFRDNPGYYGSAELLADLFGPLLSLEDLKGKAVADIGSGTGRIVNMLLDVGASRVVAVEPSAAMRVLKENTALHADKIEYLEAAGRSIAVWSRSRLRRFDGRFASHSSSRRRCASSLGALRPGGRGIVWFTATKVTKPIFR